MNLPLNIITDYAIYSSGDLANKSLDLVNGCRTNPNFTFVVGVFLLLESRQTAYVNADSVGRISGDHVKIQLADDARILLLDSISIVTNVVNTQANHDRAKLLSSGGILTEEGTLHGVLKQAKITSLEQGNPDEILITVETLDLSIGTMVKWEDLTALTVFEVDFFAQKHIIHLDGLIIGHKYRVSVAHKGSVRQVIYSDPKTFTLQG